MRSFDSAITRLLKAGTHLDEISAQRKLWRLTNFLRTYEHEQLEKSDREKDFSSIRSLSESKRARRIRRKRARGGIIIIITVIAAGMFLNILVNLEGFLSVNGKVFRIASSLLGTSWVVGP